MKYRKRIADEQLKLRLEAFGAIQIKGPKWCGKTTTAEMQARSVIKLQVYRDKSYMNCPGFVWQQMVFAEIISNETGENPPAVGNSVLAHGAPCKKRRLRRSFQPIFGG
ncbi:hypothetical protein B5E60_10755 [Alistipes sp. An116]|nr:hypothetical protein B5E60_10755 [Alistipes sp. An116]